MTIAVARRILAPMTDREKTDAPVELEEIDTPFEAADSHAGNVIEVV